MEQNQNEPYNKEQEIISGELDEKTGKSIWTFVINFLLIFVVPILIQNSGYHISKLSFKIVMISLIILSLIFLINMLMRIGDYFFSTMTKKMEKYLICFLIILILFLYFALVIVACDYFHSL